MKNMKLRGKTEMEKVKKMIVFLMCAVLLTKITGCEPEGAGNTKKERLYAAENVRLQEELEQTKKQLITKYEKQLAEQKSMLEKCEENTRNMEEYIEEDGAGFSDEMIMDILNESEQLRIENQQLKEEMERLKKSSS